MIMTRLNIHEEELEGMFLDIDVAINSVFRLFLSFFSRNFPRKI